MDLQLGIAGLGAETSACFEAPNSPPPPPNGLVVVPPVLDVPPPDSVFVVDDAPADRGFEFEAEVFPPPKRFPAVLPPPNIFPLVPDDVVLAVLPPPNPPPF